MARTLSLERHYAAALARADSGQAALAAGDLARALDDFRQARIIIVRHPGHPAWDKLLLAFAFPLAKLHLHWLQNLDELPDLLVRMGASAERLGDRRSLALKDLLQGTLSISKNEITHGLTLMAKGLQQVDALGDADIIAQSAEFRAVFYFLQGLYKDAVEYFDRLVQAANTPGGMVNASFLPRHLSPALILGYCAALLGQFHRAIGVLDCHWRRSRLQGDESNSCFHQALLGIVLLVMGRRREAYDHLEHALDEAAASGNIPALHVAQKGIAYYHFFDGRLDKAYAMVKNTVSAEAIGLQYYWPVGLEMLLAFQRQGFEPLPSFDFDKEMERILEGENLHLRGAARRIRAMQAMEQGSDMKTAYVQLKASEADLIRTGDPIELAKTRVEMARVKLVRLDRAAATHLALKAWEGVSGYRQTVFPDDLASLLEISTRPTPTTAKDRLERLIDLTDELAPSADADELLGRLVAATSRFMDAEREIGRAFV